MLDNGKMALDMVKENNIGVMVVFTKGIGKIIQQMEKVD